MEITVNGKLHVLPAPCTLSELVEQLGLTGKRIAVERNGEIAPRSQFTQTVLADRDILEIVVAVGGG